MNLISSEDFLAAMDRARVDPAGQMQEIISQVEARTSGEVVYVDAGNPVMFLLEAAVSASAHALNEIEVLTRKRFPSMAMTFEDLYLHMSDRDYLGIFATPPKARFGLMFSYEEIIARAVPVTPDGMRKLVMPKNSNFAVDGHTFTFEHPIEFRIMPHGGMSVVYGTPTNGALHELDTNLIDWDIVNIGGEDMIRVMTSIRQMAINSQVFQTNAATVFNTRVAFSDQYHFARAYIRATDEGGKIVWKEIKTTYTDQVFDPMTPTVLLKVYNGVLDVDIPMIYRTTNQITGELRLDIYTTKAVNDKILADYDASAWTIVWEDLDGEDNNVYTAPFHLLSTYRVWSDDYTRGARAALSLDELRDRVTNHNAGPINLPITNVNHARVMSDQGYSSVTSVDAITKRAMNATRTMPEPLDKYTVTPISAAIETMVLRLTDLNGVAGVSHNGDRVTLHPSILYRNLDGGLSIVHESDKQALLSLKPEAIARAVTADNFRFTPFHNVLDATRNSFAMRTYYLDSPEVTGRQFVRENPTTQLELQAARSITVTRVEDGYVINLWTISGKSYQDLDDDQVHVQLAYIPVGETSRAYLNGTLIGRDGTNERLWEFKLKTNYDINDEDALTLTNFQMFTDGPLPHSIDLKARFDIIYSVSNYEMVGMIESEIDVVKNESMLPFDSIGVLHEQVMVSLGDPLKYLWTGSRTVPTPEDYEVYEEDVPAFYETPVFERDGNGELVLRMVDGKLTANVLHNAGDPVLDGEGQPVYKYRRGDLKRDAAGNKIMKSARQLARMVDLTLFDGRYYFANDDSTVNYLSQICASMRDWSNIDLADANNRALEKTNLYFKPLNTSGQLEAIVGEGADIIIDAEQSLKVLVLMTEVGWKNEDLKKNIRRTIISTIATAFNKESVATKDIISSLVAQVGSDVLGIELSGLGGDKNYPLITMKDGGGRPSIRKKLTAKADGSFTIEEDIEIVFTPHLPARSQK